MAYRVAINGFGRIGRVSFRIAHEKPEIEIVAINDLANIKTLAHLLKYDSVYGIFQSAVGVDGNQLVVDQAETKIFNEADPTKLPWGDLGVDVVIESTGAFTEKEQAALHLKGGAKAVVISAPADGETPVDTGVLGVNTLQAGQEKVFSNGSCTTNCVTPVVAILDSGLGIESAMMTTVHAYTANQNLQDGPSKDLRRARAGALNVVPTTTGAAKTTTQVITSLQDKFDGLAIRVPVAVGSIADVTALVKQDTSKEEVNQLFTKVSDQGIYKGILIATDEPLVSSDIIGSTYSAIVDLELTKVVNKRLVKVVAWYDNEWGYSTRLIEQAINIAKQVA